MFRYYCSIFALIVVLVTAFLTRKTMIPLKVIRNNIQDNASQIAQGKADLTQRIGIKSRNEIGDVAESFNIFSETLQGIIKTMKQAKASLNSAGDKLSGSTSETMAAITQIGSNIGVLSRNLVSQTSSVEQTTGILQSETESMRKSMDEMGMSTEKINESGKALSEISSLMENSIGEIGKQVDQFTV